MSSDRGIVILPAIAGVNNYIRRVAARLEAAGWQTDIVDYFEGGDAPDLSSLPKILAALEGIDDRRVMEAVDKSVRALKSRGATSIATLGYCVGGAYSILAGCNVDGLSAVACYYGTLRYGKVSASKPASPLDRVASLRVPLIAHYGSADNFVSPSDVDQLESSLTANCKAYEMFRYSGAPHAFDEDFRPAYRPVASQEAWDRTLAFLSWYTAAQAKA